MPRLEPIELKLSVSGCNQALKELEKRRKQIKEGLDMVCKRLAQIGADAANEHYAEAEADSSWTGNGGVRAIVLPLEDGNGYRILAEGEDVFFLEFGTGDMAGFEYGGDTSNVSVPVGPKTWSVTHAQKYSEQGYWWYNGYMLYETPVYMPMYYAVKAMRERAKEVIEGVFGR